MAERKTSEYDAEPVRYCTRCYSLKIKYEEAIDSDCCMECGCSDIAFASIDRWEELYEKRYGKKYVKKNTDPKKSFVFTLSLDELKDKVYEDEHWRDIIRKLYPRFPGGLGRADSVILLFSNLIKDNRLDDLRFLLLNSNK